jgi:hypothetical protein
MDLNELFPQNSKITLNGQEYELKYNTRAKLEFESIYGNESKVLAALQAALPANLTNENTALGMKTSDLVNILYGCLIGAKNKIDKDTLIDSMKVTDYPEYLDSIFYAFSVARLTDEQVEQLQIMNMQSDSKKNAQDETTSENTHSTAQNLA